LARETPFVVTIISYPSAKNTKIDGAKANKKLNVSYYFMYAYIRSRVSRCKNTVREEKPWPAPDSLCCLEKFI